MNKINIEIYELIFEIFGNNKNLKELKINDNLNEKLMILISALYTFEANSKSFDYVIKIYSHFLNKDLDILELDTKELEVEFLKENISWIRVCLLNRVKYELGSANYNIKNKDDIKLIATNIISKNPNVGETQNITNDDNDSNKEEIHSEDIPNANNSAPSFNGSIPPILTPVQQELLRKKIQFFNPFKETPKIILTIKKVIGIICCLIIVVSLLFPIALLTDHGFLSWIAQQNKQTPTQVTGTEWLRQYAMQIPYFLIYGVLGYFMLRKPKSIQEKYSVNVILFGILIFLSVIDLITYIMQVRTFIMFLSGTSMNEHIFLLVIYIFLIPIFAMFIIALVLAIINKPTIDQAKFAEFIQKEINNIINNNKTE